MRKSITYGRMPNIGRVIDYYFHGNPSKKDAKLIEEFIDECNALKWKTLDNCIEYWRLMDSKLDEEYEKVYREDVPFEESEHKKDVIEWIIALKLNNRSNLHIARKRFEVKTNKFVTKKQFLEAYHMIHYYKSQDFKDQELYKMIEDARSGAECLNINIPIRS